MLKSSGYATAAFVSAFPLDSRFGLNAGFDVYDDQYHEGSNPLDFVVSERPAEETLAAATKWWNGAVNARRFLWIHLYDPHAPYAPPEPFASQYKDNEYLGEVAYVDAQLQKYLEPTLSADPNTLVIITGDHGEALGDHGEQTHGLFAYEATLKIPLIVIDPDRKPARVDEYVRHVDIVPTVLARAGARAPSKLPGSSLLETRSPVTTYFEALSASLNREWARLVGVINHAKKYIDLPIAELYDLKNDPREVTNLAESDRRDLFAMRDLLASAAPAPQSIQRTVDPAHKAQLLSLGYISGTSTKTTYTAADDPKNLIGVDNELHTVVAQYQTGQLQKAVETARDIVSKHPRIKVAQEMLAFLLQQSEDPNTAIDMLQRAVRAGAADEDMKVRLGLMLSENGRAKEAIDVLKPFASGNDPDVLNAYGIALADSGDLAGANAQFQRVLSVDKTNATAYQNLAVVSMRAGDVGHARENLQHALALNSKLPLALNLMGVVEAKSGNANAAIDYWRKSIAIDRRQYDAMFNLAIVSDKAGRKDVAREALQQFIATAPPQRYADDIATARAMLAQLR